MSVCKHPNNIESNEKECSGDKKYNICYGEGSDHTTLNELEEYYNILEKDAKLNEELTNVYTTGCWENKTNKPFLKYFNKLDEKDPIKCLDDEYKWITGDGYIIKKNSNSVDLKKGTASKIQVECSPGYEGEPSIEVDKCENYNKFKDGDNGEYQQFTLSGCNRCPLKYGGNRINKDDTTCYQQCGVMGTTLFESSNSNDNLRFIDTKKEFNIGGKRAGYCCNNIANSLSIEGIQGTENTNENSNYLECRINKCNDGYIKNNTGNFCCSKISNSKDNIEYSCDKNSGNTEPINKEVNFCKDGYYPFLNENGNYDCKQCEKIENIHVDAKITCDINGGNIKINPDSEYKCADDGLTYYNENDNKCVKCSHNMKINDNYDSEKKGSNICICKNEFLVGDNCFQCLGENMDYNEEYPGNNNSKCKCVIDESTTIPKNALLGGCEGKTLYNGETCNLKCKPGYNLTGQQPRCLESSFDIGTVKCTKGDKKEDETTGETVDSETTGETVDETNVVIEGFTNIFSYIQVNTNTKRLFLLFLLIILILYL